MKQYCILILLCVFLSQPASAWEINPIIDLGKPSIGGIIEKDSTYGSIFKELQEITGLKMPNAQDQVLINNVLIHTGEGYCESGVVLFQNTIQEIKIGFKDSPEEWCDDIDLIKIKRGGNEVVGVATIHHPESVWQTKDGIKIGTTLAELEKLYGNIEFTGFGWDYGGKLTSELHENLAIVLNFDPKTKSEHKAYSKVVGDRHYNSKDIPLNIKQKIKVEELKIIFNRAG